MLPLFWCLLFSAASSVFQRLFCSRVLQLCLYGQFFNLQYSALVVYVRFIMFFVFARSFSLLSYPFVFEKLPDVRFVAFFIALLHPLLLVLCFDLRSFVHPRQLLFVLCNRRRCTKHVGIILFVVFRSSWDESRAGVIGFDHYFDFSVDLCQSVHSPTSTGTVTFFISDKRFMSPVFPSAGGCALPSC